MLAQNQILQYTLFCIMYFTTPKSVSTQQMLSPAPKIVSLTALNPSTAGGDISFYDNGCKMTIEFDLSTDTGEK